MLRTRGGTFYLRWRVTIALEIAGSLEDFASDT